RGAGRFLIGGERGTVGLTEVATGIATQDFPRPAASIVAVDVSGDGRTAACGTQDGWVFVWNLADGSRKAAVRLGEKPAWYVRFLATAGLLAARTEDRVVHVVDCDAGTADVAKRFEHAALHTG